MKKLFVLLFLIPLLCKASASFISGSQKIDLRTSSANSNYLTAEAFNNANIGLFAPSDYLHIRAAEAWFDGSVYGAVLYYRIYKQGSSSLPFYSSINLSWVGGTSNQQYASSADINLLSSVTSGGTWLIEIYWEGWFDYGVGRYNNSGTNFIAYFTADNSFPVQLSSFTATIINNHINLNWTTSTETSNYGFNVEKSFDNNDWVNLGFISGNGNSNTIHNYSYCDNDVNRTGEYYYRLKQLDNNGDFVYSSTINLFVDISISFEIKQNYPNPFNSSTTISYQVSNNCRVTLKIFDILGNEVITLVDENKSKGKYDIQFNAKDISSGIYIYQIKAGDIVDSKKLVLIK